MKILLSCVGIRDPIADDTKEEGAILTLVRKVRPEMVVLFPTSGEPGMKKSSTEENAKLTADMLQYQEFSSMGLRECKVIPIVLKDPTVHRDILRSLRSALSDLLALLGSEYLEIHVNLSSGTPAMHASWLVLANSGLLPNAKLYQVATPEFGKRTPEERVSDVEYSFVREDLLIDRAKRYLAEGAFELAQRDLEEVTQITSYLDRAKKYEMLSDLAGGYACWDKIEYGSARDILIKVSGEMRRFHDLKETARFLEDQVHTLRELASATKERLLVLTDIYHNALRRFHRGEYADSVSRCWRIVEGVYYWRLLQIGVEPHNPDKTSNMGIRNFISEKRIAGDLPLLFHHCEDILTEFDDTWLTALKKCRVAAVVADVPVSDQTVGTAMNRVRKARNQSIAGHGTDSVTRKMAALALAVARSCLGYVFSGREGEIENYVFGLKAVASNLLGVLS